MDDAHRNTIQSNFSSLVEQTDLDLMVDSLFEKGVFSREMIERYKDTTKDVRCRKRQLYIDVQLRGPQAFQNLIDALQEAGYWNLVRDLDPSSFLHLHNHKPPVAQHQGNSYISISDKKKRTKTVVETQTKPNQPEPEHDVTDPVPDTEYFHVRKSKKFFDDNDSDIKLYKTRGPCGQRGMLLVFSYYKFQFQIENYRNGVDVDSGRLKDLFHEIGFTTIAYPNLTKKETEDTLKSLNSVLQGMECVFIVVSSHGYSRNYTTDIDFRCHCGGTMSLYEFLEYFNNKNLPQLVGIPKVFIFQTCRGRSEDWHQALEGEWSVSNFHMDGATWTDDDPEIPPRIRPPPNDEFQMDPRTRLYSDILIAQSTLPGFVSRRDPQKGSWYIQVLCKVFADRASDLHVEELLTLVDVELERQFKIQTSSVDKWGFNRKLYLHPGLYEDPAADTTVVPSHSSLADFRCKLGAKNGYGVN